MPKYLQEYIKQQKHHVLPFSAIATIIAITVTIRAYVYSDLFNNLVNNLENNQWEAFLSVVIITSLVELWLFFARVFSTYLYTKFRGYMNLHVRIHGVDNIVEINYHNLAKLGSGKLLQILHSWMAAYSFLIYDGIHKSIELFISFLAIAITLSTQSIWFLVYIVWAIIFVYYFQKYAFKKLSKTREQERDLSESYTKQTAKMLMNFILLKIYNIKDQELQKLTNIGQNRIRNYAMLKFRFAGIASMANLLLILLLLISLAYFGRLYLQGWISMTIVLFIFLLINFARSQFYSFGLFVAELAEKMTYINRYDEILDQAQKHKEQDEGKKLDHLKYDINFENVTFSYTEKESDIIFDEFNCKVPHGQTLAIVGKSGSGKSTLFKLLTKLVEQQQGNITFQQANQETHNIQDISYESLYKKVGYFYQDPLVFDGTIKENLTLHTQHSDDELENVLKKVELDHLTLDTIVGEKGLLLSGGEKQRLALARVFLFDYDIILLDEPTSNLDLALEKKIMKSLFAENTGKTIIAITHRPFLLDYVQRVLVLKKGLIHADGTFKEVKDKIEWLE